MVPADSGEDDPLMTQVRSSPVGRGVYFINWQEQVALC